MITMLLGGLWHGAAWNYVLWGAYQGALLCVHRLFTHGRETLPTSSEAINATTDLHGGAVQGPRFLPGWVRPPCASPFFFSFAATVGYCFVLIPSNRSEYFPCYYLDLDGDVTPVISKPTTSALLGIIVLGILQACDYHSGSLESFTRWRPPAQGFLYATLIFILIMGTSNAPVQFIYFQF